jgi:lysophospholipase L1-like esterase
VTRVAAEPARYALWLKLVACLVLFTAWVSWWFVPRWLAPAEAERLMRVPVRTDLGVLFDAVGPAVAANDLLVVFIGDSAVGGWYELEKILPPKLVPPLVAAFPGRRVHLLNLTFIGLYAEDALLIMAKAFALDADLVVYAMSPRIAPRDPAPQYATPIRDLALEWGIVSRLGLGAVLDIVPAPELARTLVYSAWPPMRLRTELSRQLLGPVVSALASPGSTFAERLVPKPGGPTRAVPPDIARGFVWARDAHRLEPPSRSTRALERLIELCAREGHCLLYHIPVNPAAVGGFESPLLDEFASWVSTRAAAAGVPFEDYRWFGESRHFVTSQRGLPDAIHPTEAGHAAFARLLVPRLVARLRELGR